MSIENLYNYLNIGKNCIKINKNLFNILSFEEAIFYSYLVSKCYECQKNNDFKYFNERVYFFSPVGEAEHTLNLTPFKQRGLLNRLQKRNLLNVKFGQARTRYVSLNDNINEVKEILFASSTIHKLEVELFNFIKDQIIAAENEKLDTDSKYLVEYLTRKNPLLINEITNSNFKN